MLDIVHEQVPKAEINCRLESKDWMRRFFGRAVLLRDMVRVDWLIQLHYQEIASDKEVLTVDMDWAGFARLVERDVLLVVTARNEGEIVGYFVCFLVELPHYKSVLVGQEDVHFVHPDYRRHGVGTTMRRIMEDALRERGAKLLRIRTKAHADNRVFLEKSGFKMIEMVYSKVL